MNATKRTMFLATMVVVALALCLSASADPPASVAPPDDRADFVFLGESRPVLIRAHVRLDGKPVQAAVGDFMKYLFTYLDLNGDNVLSKAEAERAPALDQILSGGLGQGFGLSASATPTMDELDADKDGKVTLAELSAYYRRSGFLPVQLEAESSGGNPLGMIYGGKRPEPAIEAVGAAVFSLLDTNKDGKLSREELLAAPSVLLKFDENDDEMIIAGELVPPAKVNGNAFVMMGMGGKGGGAVKSTKNFVLVPTIGEAPPDLVRRFHGMYGPATEDESEKKLTRNDIGLDEAAFAALDLNKDGVLDSKELAGFVQRSADLELTVRLGSKPAGDPRVELAKASTLSAQAQIKSGLARLDLGRTRLDLRASAEYTTDRLAGILRDQVLAQYKQADKDKNGYLDETEVKGNRFFGGLFKTMDRDGDGKLYESEVIAYFDQMADLQRRARLACVTVVLANQSRGLFDALDTDRDGRLSVREMRNAVKLFDQLNTAEQGYLVPADLPKSYQLTVRRGPAGGGGLGGAAAFFASYGEGSASDGLPELTAGPLWFRKMDRNRDGDVSRREFLGTDEQFRQIDTDSDGLISTEEAERYDAKTRKVR